MRGLRPYNMRSILLQEREFNQIMEGLTVGNNVGETAILEVKSRYVISELWL